jgi:FKBP-type peptidyl-prolyl cis-trans isomerase FkpA
MKKINLIMLLAAGIFACDSDTGKRTTPSGYEYEVIEKSGNEVPEDGQFLVINMRYEDENDSVWVDTQELGRPSVVIKQDSVWKSSGRALEEMLINAAKGDSMMITLSAEELFKGGQMPPNIQPEDKFTIYLGVPEVFNQEELQAWQQDMQEQQRKAAGQQREEQLAEDKKIIEEYFEENNITAQTTESGLSYVIKEEGSGEQAEAGDQVKVNYSGYVLGGEYFDSSVKSVAEKEGIFNPQREYGPFTFTLGEGAVIEGWDEGIALLKEGGKATLYIPSSMAYGPRQRSEKIGPNSILVFDVELVEVGDENN